MIETVAFQEKPTMSTPANNAVMPREGMFRNETPMDSNTKTNPIALRL